MNTRIFSRLIFSALALFLFMVTSCEDDTVPPKPVITSFTPDRGLPGTIITIVGKNFNSSIEENTVTISNINTIVTAASKTSLQVIVPEGATTGKIIVAVGDRSVASSNDFIVPPTITSFSPLNAVAGATVTITGTGFSPTAGNNLVTFNGKTASVTSASSTSLNVVVPNDGSTGKIIVNIGGATGTSVENFGYLPSIEEFTPTVGAINRVVTITGAGFIIPATGNQVSFNGTTAEVLSGTVNTLTIKVPANATTGPITVSSGGNSVVGDLFQVVTEVVRIAGANYESGYSIAVDGVGSTYVTGSFQGTIVLGNTNLLAQGPEDIFVAKYSIDNELLWAKRSGGAGPDRGNGIVVDNSGNSYITGYFTGEVAFGSHIVNSNGGSYDAYIAKLNSSGDFEWVNHFGSLNTDMSYEIILDHEQNPVITGSFFQTITIGTTDLTSVGNEDIFVAKFNKDSGNSLWAKSFGGTGSNSGNALSVNSAGDIYVGGSFFGTIELNGSTFSAGTILNSFIMKLSASGNVVWAKEIDGSDWNDIVGLTTDNDGNCIATGYFTNSATFGSTNLSASGAEDIFIAKYNSASGGLTWAKKAGGGDYDKANAIAKGANGNFYITGYFSGTAMFGPITATSSVNSRDIFVAEFNTDGIIQRIKTAGGEETDSGESIAITSAGVINVTGFYRDFSVMFESTLLPNSGDDDAFLWRIWPE
jgi:hypothetical protein